MPLTRTQALNGLSEGPVLRMIGCSLSMMNSRLPRIAPPRVRPWPSMYLVAECTTTSAPNSSGRCSIGVAKALSSTTLAPALCASSQTALTSTMSSIGLDGDSNSTAAAGFDSAFSHCLRSPPSTNSPCTPYLGSSSFTM